MPANLPDSVIGNTTVSETVESWFEPKSGIHYIAGSSNGRTASFEVAYRGSNPRLASINLRIGPVAQLAEQSPFKRKRVGSLPIRSTKYESLLQWQKARLLSGQFWVRVPGDSPCYQG